MAAGVLFSRLADRTGLKFRDLMNSSSSESCATTGSTFGSKRGVSFLLEELDNFLVDCLPEEGATTAGVEVALLRPDRLSVGVLLLMGDATSREGKKSDKRCPLWPLFATVMLQLTYIQVSRGELSLISDTELCCRLF